MSLIHRLLSGNVIPAFPTVVNGGALSCCHVHRLMAIPWMTAVLSLSLMSTAAWPEQLPVTKGTIVAAGFGYQVGETSTITVKVYDPLSGDVLSDETFELNVKEERSAKGNISQERIFAGGVGLGATDLSNFVLRVYDAKTGKFQWEGQLNLIPNEGAGTGQMVSTLTPRRATVTRIRALETTGRQPSFLLRALNPSTGGLVWEDEFSTDDRRVAGVERIANRFSSLDSEAVHTFDFRIRMFDGGGKTVLWEDQFAQEKAGEESHEAADDQAHVLPAWPRLFQHEAAPERL